MTCSEVPPSPVPGTESDSVRTASREPRHGARGRHRPWSSHTVPRGHVLNPVSTRVETRTGRPAARRGCRVGCSAREGAWVPLTPCGHLDASVRQDQPLITGSGSAAPRVPAASSRSLWTRTHSGARGLDPLESRPRGRRGCRPSRPRTSPHAMAALEPQRIALPQPPILAATGSCLSAGATLRPRVLRGFPWRASLLQAGMSKEEDGGFRGRRGVTLCNREELTLSTSSGGTLSLPSPQPWVQTGGRGRGAGAVPLRWPCRGPSPRQLRPVCFALVNVTSPAGVKVVQSPPGTHRAKECRPWVWGSPADWAGDQGRPDLCCLWRRELSFRGGGQTPRCRPATLGLTEHRDPTQPASRTSSLTGSVPAPGLKPSDPVLSPHLAPALAFFISSILENSPRHPALRLLKDNFNFLLYQQGIHLRCRRLGFPCAEVTGVFTLQPSSHVVTFPCLCISLVAGRKPR